MKTSTSFFAAMIAGVIAGLLIAPMKGADFRRILFESDENEGEGHTFNINELTSANSASLEQIKEKIKQG